MKSFVVLQTHQKKTAETIFIQTHNSDLFISKANRCGHISFKVRNISNNILQKIICKCVLNNSGQTFFKHISGKSFFVDKNKEIPKLENL